LAKESLLELCSDLDADESGTLTLDELLEGYRHNEEFAATMATMDVEESDMDVIFHLLDEDQSGTVSYNEFVEQLYKMKCQDTHTMLVFIKGYLNEVRMRMADQLQVMQTDVRGDCKHLLRALQRLTFGGDNCDFAVEEDGAPCKVYVQGATGLACTDGRGIAYCVCEVVGKPFAKVQTPAIADCCDLEWHFEDTISGYTPGDSLIFSVWSESLDGEEGLLGRAVLTADQIAEVDNNFDGELVLDGSLEEGSCLRVKVENLDTREQRRSILKPDDLNCSSLTTIGDDIKRLSQQMDRELSQLKEDMLGQVVEQMSRLQGQISASLDVGLQDDEPPSCPASAGKDVEPTPRRGNCLDAEGCGTSKVERQALDIYAAGCGALCAASDGNSIASQTRPYSMPIRAPMSRV